MVPSVYSGSRIASLVIAAHEASKAVAVVDQQRVSEQHCISAQVKELLVSRRAVQPDPCLDSKRTAKVYVLRLRSDFDVIVGAVERSASLRYRCRCRPVTAECAEREDAAVAWCAAYERVHADDPAEVVFRVLAHG